MEKGQTNNPNGRPRGVPNKITADIKTRIAQIVDKGFGKIESDLEALEGKQRIEVYLRLLEFIVPKAPRETKIDISSLSDVQVEELINYALTKMNDANEQT